MTGMGVESRSGFVEDQRPRILGGGDGDAEGDGWSDGDAGASGDSTPMGEDLDDNMQVAGLG